MDRQLNLQLKELRLMGRRDETYKSLETEFMVLQKQLEKMASELTKEQQDLLWAYICTSDAMDYRLLEIACNLLNEQEGDR